MCGIAGFLHFDRDRRADPHLLRAMGDALRPRGPDAGALWTDDSLGLAHRRLKIIDPCDAANQPMFSPDSQVAIVYNGECYNYRELRNRLEAGGATFGTASDTEVVLQAYLTYGDDFLHHLQGMFALAIWDRRLRRLLLARDRLGIKPLLYNRSDDTLAFASSVQALLCLPWIPRGLNASSLHTYFRAYTVQEPHSIIEGIRRLAPGGLLLADDSGVREGTWWQLDAELRATHLAREIPILDRLLQETVSSHLAADVSVGVALSGGIDSALIASLAAGQTALHSFSLVQPGSPHDEGPAAARLAAGIETTHHEVPFSPPSPEEMTRFVKAADEPFAISSGLGLYALARSASQNGVKVLLTGDGGDELFAGYPWRHAAPLGSDGRNHDPARAYAAMTCYNGPNTLRQLLDADFLAKAVEDGQERLAAHYRRCPVPDPLARRLYTDISSTLTAEMLTKTDRMTMAHGVEGRVPLLDHHLVEYALSLPRSLKIRDGQGKVILRHVAGRRLPPEVISRPKSGFNLNIANHLAATQRDWTIAQLERADKRGSFYAPDVLRRRFVAPMQAGQGFTLEESHRLFAVLVLELWMGMVMDATNEV